MIVPLLFASVILLALSALFSMSEAAFLALNKVRLRHMMQRGSLPAKLVYQLLTKLDRLIATLLVSRNAVDVTISVLGTMLCINFFGPQRGALVASVLLTLVLLVFGEMTPKLFAANHADRVALTVVWPMSVLLRIMKPVVWVFTRVSGGIIRILGGRRIARSPLITEEELKVMIEMGREAGVVAEHELRMLHRIFEFDDTLVKDVMIPRAEVAGIEISESPERVLDMFVEEGHSRLPVYRGTLDQIEGVIYARDLLAVWRHGGLFILADLVRPAYVVPPTRRVAELLTEFQRQRIQIAIVQDEQRRTLGLVTLEDLLEEIVGEIHEEIPQRGGPSGKAQRSQPRP
ncbi:MAG: HlyC/CorC family transporter [Candidatus Omnitrophica bacterium]|nr:HlyC/CorC family transporter [Candidatus Omnitrophota bacterium]